MDVVTPAQVEADLIRLTTKLEQQTDSLATLLREAAVCDVEYRLAYARAYLRSEGTVATRESEATIACQRELRARKINEAVADAAKESVRSLRDQISAVQTLSRNVAHAAGLDTF